MTTAMNDDGAPWARPRRAEGSGEAARSMRNLARLRERPAGADGRDAMASFLAQALLDSDEADELLALSARLAEWPQGPPGPGSTERVAGRVELGPVAGALFRALRSRSQGAGEQIAAWQHAVEECGRAGLHEDQALASLHLAETLLSRKQQRARAAHLLRSAHGTAKALGAEHLVREIEAVASQSHISLAEAELDELRAPGLPSALAHATPREWDVLSHLVAGRTYREIARTLFISEKTVSVHVSNLLRKTGTTSRIELAALAHRETRPAEKPTG
jgi:DNA-binding CsgD family transcriptional regulator